MSTKVYAPRHAEAAQWLLLLGSCLVTCPCCHGKGRLALVEHDDVVGRTVVTHPMCCH